jgi:hypothetical protein
MTGFPDIFKTNKDVMAGIISKSCPVNYWEFLITFGIEGLTGRIGNV